MRSDQLLIPAAVVSGILFGYSLAIISGALPFLDEALNLSHWQEGFAVSILIIGMILGALFNAPLIKSVGMKRTFFCLSFLFLGANFLSFLIDGFYTLSLYRLINGVAAGIAGALIPIYIARFAPVEKRGKSIVYFQLAITIGIFLAFYSNYFLAKSHNWQLMFFLSAPLSLLSLGIALKLPSPQKEKSTPQKPLKLFQKKYLNALVVGVGVCFFQQITGINTITFYAQKILMAEKGFALDQAFFLSALIGVLNVLATLISLYLVDTKGRKPLLLIGTFGMGASLLLFALFQKVWISPALSFVCLSLYVGFFAMSLGPIAYVLMAEVFPESLRPKAASFCFFVLSVANYAVSLLFLPAVDLFGNVCVFLLFALLSFIAFFFCLFKVPETQGKSFDEIQKALK